MSQDGYEPVKIEIWTYKEALEHSTEARDDDFVFRGLGDSSYKLIPTAYRLGAEEKLKKVADKYLEKGLFAIDEKADMGMTFYEVAALIWFYDLANRQGLRVPDIPHTYSGASFLDIQYLSRDDRLFVKEWSEIASVAQHYGAPTRMLDWTFDINVALYFAVKGVHSKDSGSSNSGSVSVCILNKSKASLLGQKIRFVVPKYCDNPNIRAQSGLFSVLAGDKPGEDLECVIKDLYKEANDGTLYGIQKDGEPILKRVFITYDDAVKLKENFRKRGMNYDTVFPGWSGVVESMEIQSGIRKA